MSPWIQVTYGDIDDHGPFDPDELVRWATSYGHPEGWAKKAQQLHGENERLRAEVRTWKQRLVDELARLRAQIRNDRENAAENCAVAIDEEIKRLKAVIPLPDSIWNFEDGSNG